jgi:microcompartment protein CcmL/EutN
MNYEINEINQFDRPTDFSNFGLDSHDPISSNIETNHTAIGNPPEHLDLESWENRSNGNLKREAGVTNNSHQQQWIQQFIGNTDDYATSMTKDKDGNLYLTGSTEGDFAGRTGESGYDAWVAKYDINGDRIWIKQLGSPIYSSTNDYSTGIATDISGNVYLTGHTYSNLAGTHAGGGDVWIAKYDSEGNRLWTRQFGSPYIETATGIVADNKGNIYLNGSTNGDLAGRNPDDSRFSNDIWIAKYDSEGNRLWAKQVGSLENEYSGGITTDSNGNVCVIGSTGGDLAGTNSGGYDTWIAKYNGNGDRVWDKQFASSDLHYSSQDLVTDSSDNIYFTDRNAEDINSGVSLIKYDSNGNLIWMKPLGFTADLSPQAIAIDSDSNFYMTGSTSGDFAEKNAGLSDVWVAKHDSNGNKIWAKQFGSSSWDYSRGIVADDNGNMYLTGSTHGDLASKNFGQYSKDVWVAKLNPNAQSKIAISATDAKATETASGKTRNPGEFTITRTGDISNPLTVNYSVDGKAKNGEDYQEVVNKVIIPKGRNEVFVHLEVFDDIYPEYPETGNATIEPNFFYEIDTARSAKVTIADNEIPVISIAAIDPETSETKTGEKANPGKLRVRRVGNLSNPLTVNYTVSGTAIKDADYKLPSKITFAAGKNIIDLPMPILDDAVVEGVETAKVTLTSGSGYKLSQTRSSTVSIADNDK